MATGIKDKVAIIGMGCTRFGERWDVGAEELMVEAFEECLADAGIEPNDIQAAWLGTCMDEVNVGKSALPLSMTLRLPLIPVTRVENFCASGTEAFRGAVLRRGLRGLRHLPGHGRGKAQGHRLRRSAQPGLRLGRLAQLALVAQLYRPGPFAQLASAYAAKYRIPDAELKRAMAHVSVKSHANGVLNPKAHLRKPVTVDQVMAAPIIAHPLGLFDCCGVSDGAACAIVTTVGNGPGHGQEGFRHGQGPAAGSEQRRGDGLQPVGRRSLHDHRPAAASRPTRKPGITDPRKEISMMEVHDCFSDHRAGHL